MTVSLVTLPGTLFVPGIAFLFFPAMGVFLATIAFCALIAAAHRNTNLRLEPRHRASRKRMWKTSLFVVAILIGQGYMMLNVMAITRDVSKATVTAANLRGIGQAVFIYHNDDGEYPAVLKDLTAANLTIWKQFISYTDPNIMSLRRIIVRSSITPGQDRYRPTQKSSCASKGRPGRPFLCATSRITVAQSCSPTAAFNCSMRNNSRRPWRWTGSVGWKSAGRYSSGIRIRGGVSGLRHEADQRETSREIASPPSF